MEIRVFAGPTGISARAYIAVWILNVSDILRSLQASLDQRQFNLATDLVERWGFILPHLMRTGEERVMFDASELPDLRDLFARLRGSAQEVAEYRGHGIPTVADCIGFCDAELEGLDQLAGVGEPMYCEVWVLERLVYDCKELLRVVLGPEAIKAFVVAYDACMARLREDNALAMAKRV